VRILVVGAGALGQLFASRLAEYAEVCIKTEWIEQADAIRKGGVAVVAADGAVSTAHVQVAVDVAEIPWEPDVALICIKVYETSRKLRELVDVLGGAAVVTIQNGLAQLDIIRGIVRGEVCAAPTYQAATKLGAAKIRHSANGETIIWTSGPMPRAATEFCALMVEAGMPARVDRRGEHASWEKLIVTAGLNALAAVLLVPVGALADSPKAHNIARDAAEEARRLADHKGVGFAAAELVAAVDGAIERTARNYSSMTQDILSGRSTEVDFVNGFVASESEMHGLAAPVNRLLCDLVHALSETSGVRIER
jgi:2-dehydropantoate 2-reductase